jgi:hypothetical protein
MVSVNLRCFVREPSRMAAGGWAGGGGEGAGGWGEVVGVGAASAGARRLLGPAAAMGGCGPLSLDASAIAVRRWLWRQGRLMPNAPLHASRRRRRRCAARACAATPQTPPLPLSPRTLDALADNVARDLAHGCCSASALRKTSADGAGGERGSGDRRPTGARARCAAAAAAPPAAAAPRPDRSRCRGRGVSSRRLSPLAPPTAPGPPSGRGRWGGPGSRGAPRRGGAVASARKHASGCRRGGTAAGRSRARPPAPAGDHAGAVGASTPADARGEKPHSPAGLERGRAGG